MPSTPMFLATMAVLMPTSAPAGVDQRAAELPKLIGASVWMKSSSGAIRAAGGWSRSRSP